MSTPAAATPRCTYLEPLEVQLTRGYFLIALLPLPRQRSTGPGRPPNRCSYTPPQRTHSHSARQRCGTGRNAECSCATCRIGREEVRVQRTGREGTRASELHGTHEHAGWGARGRSTLRMREAEQRQLDREIEARPSCGGTEQNGPSGWGAVPRSEREKMDEGATMRRGLREAL
jgi:hypothetical protein